MPPSIDEPRPDDVPPFRYGAALAGRLEARWQARWASEGTYHAPNPKGELSEGFEKVKDRPTLFVLDMFPYPSDAGLHVGHPLGYIGTDVYARYKRMKGFNVLHTMGFDAFGLPAEQYAVQTGQHPRITTEANIAAYRRELRALGLGHDERRSFATTDPSYHRWTQWIFLQLFNSWYDNEAEGGPRARAISELMAELESGQRFVIDDKHPDGRPWAELDEAERRTAVDDHRLVYLEEAPVNWCPGLGTVLANEEVTADGRSDRGNFPVYRRALEQWMMRITAYAERLIDDLDLIDWPLPVKLMQRNWIGRSEGAMVDFPLAHEPDTSIAVFTTRPDTLFGATYVVLAPEHPLVERIVGGGWPEATPATWRGSGLAGLIEDVPITGWESPSEAVAAYRRHASRRSDVDRQVESREKTGVFTGGYAVNPATGEHVPIFVADYVLMGYGTGAIMAVPAHDQRDFEFALAFEITIPAVVEAPSAWWRSHDVALGTPAEEWPEAYEGEGISVSSSNDGVVLDGLDTPDAKRAIIAWLESTGAGAGSVNYRLRDWLFSRQRYWGEPFPIVFDEDDLPVALPESMLPVELPEIDDYAPSVLGEGDESVPEPPLGRATEWVEVTLDLGKGAKRYRRELNTMPQWAGSCWYYLRYLDPANDEAMVDPVIERYWMQGSAADGSPAFGGVDLYVGGVEHAVLHLLYARFWHKVLFDLGYVSTPEPFQRLFNQGYVLAPAFTDERGIHVDAASVVEDEDGTFTYDGAVVQRHMGKMGKSLRNGVSPQEIFDEYGADTLRLYEMSTGPLDAERPWNTRDIIGVHRFLQRLWRNLVDEHTGDTRVSAEPAPPPLRRLLHHTIAAVGADFDRLSFNTAIARLIELNNALTQLVAGAGSAPAEVAEAMVSMVAPLAPHVGEELWAKLGHAGSVVWADFPAVDAALLVDEQVEVPVQVGGKIRTRLNLAPNADAAVVEAAALADPKVQAALAGREIARVVVVPGRMVNIVTA